MLNKIAVQLECWEIKVIYLEKSSITNVSSVRIYIGTTMGYPTQFSMIGKLNKEGDIEYNTSVLNDEINFDWSRMEFKYQDEPIFSHEQCRFLYMENLKLGN